MRVTFYADVYNCGFDQTLFASTKPNQTYSQNIRRFAFTVTIPDDAFTGKLEYAPVVENIEVDK